MTFESLAIQLERLPRLLSDHLLLTLCALAAGIAISVPLGMLAAQQPRLRGPILTTVSILQTIPGFALLAFMAVVLQLFGWLPAFLALVLYSMLPIVRNTVTGLLDITPSVVEAARGIGMTEWQLLTRVRLPLAAPVIIAGVRTATVWTVGLATLATPIGATSLGNFIFSGLYTRQFAPILVGVVAAAGLALVLDGLVRLLERGLDARDRRLIVSGAAALLVLVSVGLYPAAQRGIARATETDREIVIGAKSFNESEILARLIARRLSEAGFPTNVRTNLGSTVAFEAVANNDIDLYVEYTGTAWANYMNRDTNPGKDAMYEQVTAWLDSQHAVSVPGRLGFENLYTLSMEEEQATRLGIETIEQLAGQAGSLIIVSDYEFFARPEWQTLQDTYGLDFREELAVDPGLMYDALVSGDAEVITAYSTDGRIDAFDLRVLDDTRQAFLPYDAILCVSERAAATPGLTAALEPLVGAIDNATMRAANKVVDVDGRPVREAVDQLEAALALD